LLHRFRKRIKPLLTRNSKRFWEGVETGEGSLRCHRVPFLKADIWLLPAAWCLSFSQKKRSLYLSCGGFDLQALLQADDLLAGSLKSGQAPSKSRALKPEPN